MSRRGGTTTGLVVTLSIIGVLGASAVVVTPRLISAASEGPEPSRPARRRSHQEQIEALGRLIGRSRALLSLVERTEGPYLELALWFEDADGSGAVESGELWVISHSRVLQTVTLYERPAGDDRSGAAAQADPRARSFCDRFRADPKTTARVLVRAVSDMRVERLDGAPPQAQRLRVSLTWSAESADGADEASVVVDAAIHPRTGHGGG